MANWQWRMHEATRYLLVCSVLVITVGFITDNEVLATAANKRDFVHSLGHWSLQPILADFIASTANMAHSIIKIGRDANSVADNLAKKARRAAVPTCLFSCESWTHSRNCTIQMALDNFQWGNS